MCQKLKKFLSALVFAFLCSCLALAQGDASDLQELQDLAQNLSQESLQQINQQIISQTESLAKLLSANQQIEVDKQSLKELELLNSQLKSSEFLSMKLSDQLRLIKKQQNVSTEITKSMLAQRTALLTSQSNIASNMSSLLNLYSKQSAILQKIVSSQSEEAKLTIEQLNSTQIEVDNLKSQLDLCATLQKKQQEEMDFYKSKSKNSYIYGNIITPLPGLMLLGYGIAQFAIGNTTEGKDYMIIGGATTITMEVVFQGGHLLLKWW